MTETPFIAPSRILLVDDIEENLVALEALLRRPDADIVCARSGVEALELVLREEFALAFIDVQMPEMDGYELAELLRGAERSKYIPIIFVTAGARDATRVFKGYESGAVDFLFKPIDAHQLRQKADTFLGLDQQKKRLAEQFHRLQENEAALREAVQARDDVLAVVSHDIRNFLQSIRSGVQLLTQKPEKLSAEVKTVIHGRITTTVDLMTRVIADLLDMTNIRNGRIEIDRRPEIIGNLIDEAVSVHEPLAQDKGITLTTRCDQRNEVVLCDRARILQVFSNLLGNAIKFCGKGDTITVTARSAGGGVEISVTDSGPGIAAADLPMVFDAYWSATNNRHKGTGLGLYITKSIVEAHGMRIWIESELGRGTTVFFMLGLAEELPKVREA
jgi:two-component system sensor histidine kinase/response regulator